MITDLVLRLRALFGRATVEREIDDELQFHLDRQVAAYVAQGIERADAVRRARLEFGGVDQVKEEYRDALGVRLVDDLCRELSYVVRTLWRTPGFSVAAISTLAVAIAANSAIFGTVYAVLLQPLPITDADRLVVFWGRDASRDRGVVELSYRDVQDWRTANQSFAEMAAVGSSNWTAVMYGRGDAARVPIAGVTASFFDTLGARPLLGRTFQPSDDTPNAAGVVVLNHGAWTRRFGADPGVIGTTLTLDRRLHTIVGVMPKGFDFPRNAEFWLPVVPILAASSAEWGGDALANVGVLLGLGRLRNGFTPVLAAQELDRLASFARTDAVPSVGPSVTVTPFLDHVLGPVRTALWILFSAVAVLLLVACANVSALMLSRMMLRRQEHAVRSALGASRLQMRRLCMLETAVLSKIALVGGRLFDDRDDRRAPLVAIVGETTANRLWPERTRSASAWRCPHSPRARVRTSGALLSALCQTFGIAESIPCWPTSMTPPHRQPRRPITSLFARPAIPWRPLPLSVPLSAPSTRWPSSMA